MKKNRIYSYVFFLLLNGLGFNVLLAQPCGGSLQFNNNSDEVLLPLNNQMHSSNGFTWECWFKLNTAFGSKARSLIMNEDPVVYEDIFLGFGWNLGMGNFPINRLGFKVDGPNSTTGPSNVACDYAPPGGFLLGTWYHAAGVMNYNTQTAKLYLNGILVDTQIVNSDPITRNVQGHLSYSPNLALGGNEDEIRIWKRVRTDAEILSDYNHCLSGSETDLVSYYRCNQSSGTILLDGTSNGNNGTLVNSTIWSVQQPTLSGSSCLGTGSFSVNITATCNGANATAVSSVSTTMTSPVLSYSWANSSGIIVGQTTNTSALTNSLTNLSGGIYTLSVQVNAPCGPIISQTISVNCTPPPLCSGTLGAPVFLEDFGSGTALYGPALPPGITSYIYQTGPPPNGTYVISSNSNPSGINAGYVADNDHTGNTNGYMMVINSDYPASEVFRKNVTGLCQNTTYVFSAFISNNNTPSTPTTVCPGYVYANVKFQIEYPVSTIQNSITTGPLPLGLSNTALNWQQYGFTFTTLPGQTSVDIVLKNNAPGGCGNDYVVDDISLSPCGPGVALSIVPNQTVFCTGDSIKLQSNFTSGNYSNPQYQWQNSSNGGTTWSNISGATSANYNISAVSFSQAGMYRLIIAENGNINLPSCSIVAGPLTFSVSNGTLSVSSQTICSGTTTTLSATGATSYTWSNGAVTNSIVVNPSTTTSYSITGSSGSCTSQAVSTVSVIPNSTISITGNTVICAGQSSILTANGSGSFTWNTGASTASISVSPVVTSTYNASSAGGLCSSVGTITVNVVPSPTISVTGTMGICSNQTTVLTASGANNYVWSTSAASSSISVNPNATASYSVVGMVGTCTNQAVVTITVNSQPTISSLNHANSECGLSNGSATVSVLPSSCTYLWGNGSTSNISSNFPPGIQTLSISNNGCVTQTFVTIASEPGPLFTSISVNNTSCGLSNGSATVTTTPSNNTYFWSSGITSTTNTVASLPSGTYTIYATNGACQTDTSVTILNSTPLQIVSSTIVASDCNATNGSIAITDNGVNSVYSWSPGISSNSSSIINLAAGTYSLNITDGACATNSVFVVPLLNGPTGLNVIQKNAICLSKNGTLNVVAVLNGLSPYQYNFNNSGFSSTSTFNNLSQGIYSISVKDANNCTFTQTYTIGVSQTTVTINQTIKSTSCDSDDGEIRVSGISGGTAPYLMSFNNTPYQQDTVFGPLSAGVYSLSVLDFNKCVTGFSIIVPENDEDYTLYVPNTFTPNTDIVNDIWYVQGTCLGEFNCVIYNRWGEKIIELKDIKEGWNGKYKENEVPEGIYVYVIKVNTKTGTIRKSGHITVFR